MKKYQTSDLQFENDVTFVGIPGGEFDDFITALNNMLCYKMKENDMMESESIEFSKNFVVAL